MSRIRSTEQARAMVAKRDPESYKKPRITRTADKTKRALRLQELKLQGYSREQIAQKLNVHVDTLDNINKWAIQNGVFALQEQRIAEELTPLALTTLTEAMEKGNVKAALGVLTTFMKLGDRLEEQKKLAGKAEIDFQTFMLKRQMKKADESDREAGAIEAQAVVVTEESPEDEDSASE